MTTVRFRYNGGDIAEVTAVGHTGYADEGSDIVCAGVSAVIQSTLLGLLGIANVPLTHTVDTKKATISIKLDDDMTEWERHDANILLETLRLAVKDISAGYPAHVKVEEN